MSHPQSVIRYPISRLMESPENNHLAFVIRIWSEESEASNGRAWRGRIVSIHNERQYLYFQHLWEILIFMVPMLSSDQLRVHWSTKIIVRLLGYCRGLFRFSFRSENGPTTEPGTSQGRGDDMFTL